MSSHIGPLRKSITALSRRRSHCSHPPPLFQQGHSNRHLTTSKSYCLYLCVCVCVHVHMDHPKIIISHRSRINQQHEQQQPPPPNNSRNISTLSRFIPELQGGGASKQGTMQYSLLVACAAIMPLQLPPKWLLTRRSSTVFWTEYPGL